LENCLDSGIKQQGQIIKLGLKMLKLLLVLMIFFVNCETTFPQFRETKWGQLKQQVKKLEKAQLMQEKDEQLLFYEKTTLLGMNSFIIYDFFNDILYSAGYLFEKSDLTYIDFVRVKELLINKYGINKESEGEARMTIATWNTKETLITLMLINDQQKIVILYKSKKYEYLQEEKDNSKL
jgi:hypothetical protein